MENYKESRNDVIKKMTLDKQEEILIKRSQYYKRGKVKSTLEAVGWNLRQLMDYLEAHNLMSIKSNLDMLRDVRELTFNVTMHLTRLKRLNIKVEANIEINLINMWIMRLANTIDCGNIYNELNNEITTGELFLRYHYRKLTKILNPIINNLNLL